MQESTKHYVLAFVGTIAAIDLLWRWYKHHQAGQVADISQEPIGASTTAMPVAQLSQNGPSGFENPMMYGTPGLVYFASPQQPFQSTINVSVNPDVAQFLSNHYIPMFGFVGMGGQ